MYSRDEIQRRGECPGVSGEMIRQLLASEDRLRVALRKIAEQETYEECNNRLQKRGIENHGDYIDGYDALIAIAREALK